MLSYRGSEQHRAPVRARRQRGSSRPALIAGALIAAAVFPETAAAQIAPPSVRSGEHYLVPVGKSQLLHVDRPFSQVLIGSQDTADVLPMNGNTLYVLGKKAGATNLTLYDAHHTLVAVIDLLVGADAAGLREQLATLLPREHISVRTAGDSLVLEGQVANAIAAERAVKVAETYAPGKVINFLSLGAPQQVLLEVRFSEMQRNTAKSLGIRSLAFSNTGNFVSGTGDTAPSNSFGTVSGSFSIGVVNINLALDALEQKGLVNTLAQPNLIALSGETASFLAGGEFPVPVSSTLGAGGIPTISIQFKEFGVSLAFTPTVLADGVISLVVAPEVSSLDATASIRLNGISIPGLRTRRARTTLEMRDGESFAIAGLVGADFSNTVRQIPLLGSIPIIGALFRSTSFNRNETELVITVTPHIVRPVAPAALALPTEQFRAPGEADQFLLGARNAPPKDKP